MRHHSRLPLLIALVAPLGCGFCGSGSTLSITITGRGDVELTGHLPTQVGVMTFTDSCAEPSCDIGLPESDELDAQITIDLTFVAAPGWIFDHSDCAATFFTGGDVSCSVTFVPAATLTLDLSGAGTIIAVPPALSCTGTHCAAAAATGTLVSLQALPADGFQFAGWGGDCSGSAPSVSLVLDGDKACTATFTGGYAVTVIIDSGGTVVLDPPGTDCSATCSESVTSGESITLNAMAWSTSVFSGWSGDCAGSAPLVTVTADGAKTCTAHFVPLRTLTVALSGAGQGQVVSDPAGTIDCGASCSATLPQGSQVVLRALPADGSIFDAWSGACPGAQATDPFATTVTFVADGTCTARFEPAPPGMRTLTVTKDGSTANGSVTSAPAGLSCDDTCLLATASWADGTALTLTATPDADAVFAGWGGACAGAGSDPDAPIVLDADAHCVATFTARVPTPHTLTVIKTGASEDRGRVTSSPAGIDCGQDCSASFGAGTLVTLTATTLSGSTFAGWSGDCSGLAATQMVTMTADRTCTADFTSTSTCDASFAVAQDGPTLYLRALHPGAGDSYFWSFSWTTATQSTSGASTSIAAPPAGSYTISLFLAATAGECTSMQTVAVTM